MLRYIGTSINILFVIMINLLSRGINQIIKTISKRYYYNLSQVMNITEQQQHKQHYGQKFHYNVTKIDNSNDNDQNDEYISDSESEWNDTDTDNEEEEDHQPQYGKYLFALEDFYLFLFFYLKIN